MFALAIIWGTKRAESCFPSGNIFTFFNTYAQIDKPVLEGYQPAFGKLTPTDRWLVLRTNAFIKRATEVMDDYKTYLLVKDFEVFVDDISNWYIRTNRRRFWKTEDEADKMVAYWALFYALNTCVQVMSPIIPFMTEHILAGANPQGDA